MRRSLKVITAAAAAALIGSIAASAAIAGSDGPPPRAPYVDTHGRVDVSKMPKRLPALDSAGKTVGYVNTNDLMSGGSNALPLYADDHSDRTTGKTFPVVASGISVESPSGP